MSATGNVTQSTQSIPFIRRMLSPTWITIWLTVIVVIIVSVAKGPFALVNSLVTGGMWALMAAGLTLMFGVMNIPNFAHGEFFMIGTLMAYFVFNPITKYLRQNPSPALAAIAPFAGIILAVVVGALLGFVIEKIIFSQLRRRSKEQWVMNTFLLTAGLSVVMINGTLLIWGSEFKGVTRYWDVDPLDFFGVNLPIDRIVAFVIALITIVAFWFFMQRTGIGRAIRAVAQDEVGAQMLGIDLNLVHTLTLSLSSALAALAGASLLFMFPSYPTVGLKPLYVAWYVVILAGLGNVQGAIAGGFIVALLQTLTSYFIGPGWEDVVPTALIILILLFKPSGLFGSEVKGVWEQ
jgi:branched-chain amino acid transport system permease protein